jgi:hypothetical protein
MRGHRSLLTFGLVLVSGLTLARGEALGQSAPEQVFLKYSGVPGCSDAATFRSEFRARTSRAVLREDGDPGGRSFTITVAKEQGRIVGRVEQRRADGSTSEREVSGQSCAEVISALALIAALAVDPQAASAHAPQDPDEAAPSLGKEPAPAPPPPPEPSVRANEESRKPEPDPRHVDNARWRLAAGVQGGVVSGMFPKAAFASSIFVETGLWSPSVLAPTIRLSAIGSISRSVPAERGEAHFQWAAAGLQGCPLRFRLRDELHGYPCVFGEAGFLAGEGTGVSEPDSRTRPWFGLGALIRLQWTPSEQFFVEAEGGIRVPLARDRFVFDLGGRTDSIHVVGLGGAASIGLGIRAP